jgi:hypothetical protein
MKKAEIAGEIFIYVIAVVVVGFILIYGYSAIKDFSKRGEEVEYISLKTDFENAFKSITSDYGSVKRPSVSIPGKYEFICFVKRGLSEGDIDLTPLCTGGVAGYPAGLRSPIACSAWKNGRSNVFFLPDGSDNFDVGEIQLSSGTDRSSDLPFLCLEVVNNKINLQLKGLGSKVEVSEYE